MGDSRESSDALVMPSPAKGGEGPSLERLLELRDEMGPERWRVVSDAAQVVAAYLACHPRVAAVRYPGLKADPAFSRAATTLRGGFGPVLDFLPADGTWQRYVADESDPCDQVIALEAFLNRI